MGTITLSWEMSSEQAAQVEARRSVIADVFARGGIEADEVAELVLDAVRTKRFYILTHPAMTVEVEARFDRIVAGESPLPPVL